MQRITQCGVVLGSEKGGSLSRWHCDFDFGPIIADGRWWCCCCGAERVFGIGNVVVVGGFDDDAVAFGGMQTRTIIGSTVDEQIDRGPGSRVGVAGVLGKQFTAANHVAVNNYEIIF